MNDAGAIAGGARPRISGRAAAALLLFAALAVATRFWALGDRPLHHDESIHAYQSWTLSRGGDWRYDPAYHGPFLYYANALVYKIVGATDATARFMPAIFGLILIAFAFPRKRWIGRNAAAVYAVFVLLTAHFWYFSRFIREDLYSLVFTFGTIVAFQRFLETDRARWLLAAAAAFAFAGVTKENAYMTGVLFVTYGLWCLVRTATDPRGPKPRAALAAAARWSAARSGPIVTAAILFLIIWATMYTAFGKYPGDWLAIPKAVKYWMGQHAIARIPGPWWYYFPQLAYYDTAILVAAIYAFRWRDWRSDPLLRTVLVTVPLLALYVVVHLRIPTLGAGPATLIALVLFIAGYVVAAFVFKPPPESTLTPFVQFLAFWAVGALAIYAWAREKVPWLTVHPLLPLTILGAMGVARLWDERGRPSRRAALAAIAVLLAINTRGAYLAVFRYGAHDLEREPGHAEMLAYVQTSKDLVRSLSVVDQARARVAPGQNIITVAGESAWPLTWYLRDVPTAWATRIEQASTPIIVADWDPEGALEKQLAPRYDAKRVPIRAWWFPEPKTEAGKSRPTLKDFFRWWLFHEIWSPIGSQDATLYVRKDLGGSGMLEPLEIAVQDTSARDYPSDGVELPPGRAFGGPGAGPGQFAEPRGVAADPRGNLYVADTKNSRIEIFDGNGAFLRALGGVKGAGDGQLNEPCGVAVGPDGEIYVADTWNHRVARFSADGQWHGEWKDPERGFFGPRSVVAAKGFVYVSDTGNKRIVKFDEDGRVAGSWGSAGNGPGQFVEPVGIAADASGRIYVADTGNHRVQVFEGDGTFVRQFPVYGWKDFYTEPYLAVGPSDSVFVTDAWKGRIAQYDAAGNLQKSYKADGLKSPTGIALDPFGRLVVSDRGQSRVLSWGLSDFLR